MSKTATQWPAQIDAEECVVVKHRGTVIRLREPKVLKRREGGARHYGFAARAITSYFDAYGYGMTREEALDRALEMARGHIDRTCELKGVKGIIGY